MADPQKVGIVAEMMKNLGSAEKAEQAQSEAITKEAMQAMMRYMPLRALINMAGVPREMIEGLVTVLNQ